MKRRSQNEPLHLAEHFLSEQQLRIARQKQLIAMLRRQGRPTADAERTLKTYEINLLKLRNHRDIMQEIMGGDSPKSAGTQT